MTQVDSKYGYTYYTNINIGTTAFLLMSEKVNFTAKGSTRDKETYVMRKRSIHEEGTIVLYVYIPNKISKIDEAAKTERGNG